MKCWSVVLDLAAPLGRTWAPGQAPGVNAATPSLTATPGFEKII